MHLVYLFNSINLKLFNSQLNEISKFTVQKYQPKDLVNIFKNMIQCQIGENVFHLLKAVTF